jgi:ketosteroid isomerase-like protein
LILVGLYMSAQTVSTAEGQSDPRPDERAIRAAAKEYVMAKRRGDSEALANIWTPDGDYVDASGQVFKARDLVRRQVSASATTAAPEPIVLPESSLRFITPDVAIEDGSGVRNGGRRKPLVGAFHSGVDQAR